MALTTPKSRPHVPTCLFHFSVQWGGIGNDVIIDAAGSVCACAAAEAASPPPFRSVPFRCDCRQFFVCCRRYRRSCSGGGGDEAAKTDAKAEATAAAAAAFVVVGGNAQKVFPRPQSVAISFILRTGFSSFRRLANEVSDDSSFLFLSLLFCPLKCHPQLCGTTGEKLVCYRTDNRFCWSFYGRTMVESSPVYFYVYCIRFCL